MPPKQGGKGKRVGGRGGAGGQGRGGTLPIRSGESSKNPQPPPPKEDDLIKTLPIEKRAVLPFRPSYGTQGRPVELLANYFPLTATWETVMHRHSVTFQGKTSDGTDPPAPKPEGETEPADLPKKIKKRLLEILISDHLEKGEKILAVSDFSSIIITDKKMDITPKAFVVTYRDEQQVEPEENAHKHRIVLQHNGTLSMSTLVDFTTSAQASSLFGSKQELLQALNIVVGHHPKTQRNISTFGTNRHVNVETAPGDRRNLGSGLEAIRAFVFSVRSSSERLLVNVHVKNLAFYQAGRLDEVVREVRGLVAQSQFVKKVPVELEHLRRILKSGAVIPRRKTISGFASPQDGSSLPHPPRVPKFGAGPSDVKFWLDTECEDKNGKPIPGKQFYTVQEYFSRRYGREVDVKNPVVNTGTRKEPTYVPMEVCIVRRGQPALGKISPTQTEQMIRFAVRNPKLNEGSLLNSGLPTLGLNGPNASLQAFGLNVESNLISVPARILATPKVLYGTKPVTEIKAGSWNMIGNKVNVGRRLRKWGVIRITQEHQPDLWDNDYTFTNSIELWETHLRSLGLLIEAHPRYSSIKINQNNRDALIRDAIALHSDLDFILFVIPELDKIPVYNQIKTQCEIKREGRTGICNVCMLDTKFHQGKAEINANVGLKVNLKLGGCNHRIDPASFGDINSKETMFVGIDVTHPSPNSLKGAPSIAAVVSSVDQYLAQWPAQLRKQGVAKQEMVDALKEMIQHSLVLWKSNLSNQSYPKNIIVYRDGVSESQYQTVLDKELPALQEGIAKTYPAKGLPKLSIIIVGKRHHTRFWYQNPPNPNDANPPCGTVVDRGVTEVANWDFYLQAHKAVKGTARPAHYYVIYDEVFAGLQPRSKATHALENLSHSLCYAYGPATKAISICPPAYYADLACERARIYLSRFYSPSASEANAASQADEDPGSVSNLVMNQDLEIAESVKNTMFYI